MYTTRVMREAIAAAKETKSADDLHDLLVEELRTDPEVRAEIKKLIPRPPAPQKGGGRRG